MDCRFYAHGYLRIAARVGARIAHESFARWWLMGHLSARMGVVRARRRTCALGSATRGWRAGAAERRVDAVRHLRADAFREPRAYGALQMAFETWGCACVQSVATDRAKAVAEATAARSRLLFGLERWLRCVAFERAGETSRSLDLVVTLVRHATERRLASQMLASFARWKYEALENCPPVLKQLRKARRRMEASGMRPIL